MSHKYAIVKDGVVTNLVQWDGTSEFNVDGYLVEATHDAWIGGGYADGTFAARPAPEPVEPTAEELQAATDKQSAVDKLTALGLTEDEINALIG